MNQGEKETFCFLNARHKKRHVGLSSLCNNSNNDKELTHLKNKIKTY